MGKLYLFYSRSIIRVGGEAQQQAESPRIRQPETERLRAKRKDNHYVLAKIISSRPIDSNLINANRRGAF